MFNGGSDANRRRRSERRWLLRYVTVDIPLPKGLFFSQLLLTLLALLESSSGSHFLTLLLCVLFGREGAKNLLYNGVDLILLLLGVPVIHVLDTGAQNGKVLRTHVKDHDGFTLGEVVRAQLFDQTLYCEAIVRDWILSKGVWGCAEVLQKLMKCQ